MGNLVGAVLGLEQSLGPGDLERVAEWPKHWLRKGREQGIREVVERLERIGAEPAPGDAPEGVGMTLEERVAERIRRSFGISDRYQRQPVDKNRFASA